MVVAEALLSTIAIATTIRQGRPKHPAPHPRSRITVAFYRQGKVNGLSSVHHPCDAINSWPVTTPIIRTVLPEGLQDPRGQGNYASRKAT